MRRTNATDKMDKANDGLRGTVRQDAQDYFVRVRGHFRLDRWKGKPFENYYDTPVDEKNLVVTLARRVMSRLISGAAGTATVQFGGSPIVVSSHPEYLYITQMRFGTGGHDPLHPTIPIPPNPSDEALAAPITSPAYKAVTTDYPSETSVRFTATLEQSEANGEGLSEEGLFCTGNGVEVFLFARKTFGLLTKTSDFSFTFAHTILF